MFRWTPDMVRLRKDAAEYGGFDAKIAARILPHLAEDADVCDAGCGLGYLALALAPHCRQVTATDICAPALAVLRENVKNAGIANIDIVECDFFDPHAQERYDSIVFCLFGGVSQTLRAVQARCRGKAFLIKKNWDTHRFALEEKPLRRRTFLQTCAELDELGVPFQTELFPLDMGQPFRSLSDAALFFRAYGGEKNPSADTERNIAQRLEETGLAEFPYYLPSCRELGLIVLNAQDIPDAVKTMKAEV